MGVIKKEKRERKEKKKKEFHQNRGKVSWVDEGDGGGGWRDGKRKEQWNEFDWNFICSYMNIAQWIPTPSISITHYFLNIKTINKL